MYIYLDWIPEAGTRTINTCIKQIVGESECCQYCAKFNTKHFTINRTLLENVLLHLKIYLFKLIEMYPF